MQAATMVPRANGGVWDIRDVQETGCHPLAISLPEFTHRP